MNAEWEMNVWVENVVGKIRVPSLNENGEGLVNICAEMGCF